MHGNSTNAASVVAGQHPRQEVVAIQLTCLTVNC
ncbi:hypothetical protein Ae505Ps2_6260c [Pseudonocardia sp. Ae505_Ps2]|nr:hypothetical protein Ae505Ps2_6260c [Pseudonocardia sp. Ae505_Ps2]